MKRGHVAVLVAVTAAIAGTLGFFGHRIASPERTEPPEAVALLFSMGEDENGMYIIGQHVLDPERNRDQVAACLMLQVEAINRHWRAADLACVLTTDVEFGQSLREVLNLRLKDGS